MDSHSRGRAFDLYAVDTTLQHQRFQCRQRWRINEASLTLPPPLPPIDSHTTTTDNADMPALEEPETETEEQDADEDDDDYLPPASSILAILGGNGEKEGRLGAASLRNGFDCFDSSLLLANRGQNEAFPSRSTTSNQGLPAQASVTPERHCPHLAQLQPPLACVSDIQLHYQFVI